VPPALFSTRKPATSKRRSNVALGQLSAIVSVNRKDSRSLGGGTLGPRQRLIKVRELPERTTAFLEGKYFARTLPHRNKPCTSFFTSFIFAKSATQK
jgi:hypothetical protein